MSSPITVVIAEHQVADRAACLRLLEAERGIRVVGEAKSGLEAITSTGRLRPRILLLDLALARAQRMPLIPALRQKSPQTKVILLTDGASDGPHAGGAVPRRARLPRQGSPDDVPGESRPRRRRGRSMGPAQDGRPDHGPPRGPDDLGGEDRLRSSEGGLDGPLRASPRRFGCAGEAGARTAVTPTRASPARRRTPRRRYGLVAGGLNDG